MALQMTCPFCKREFPYDNGRLDVEISRNAQRITEIGRRLTEIKYALHTKETWKEKRKLEIELTRLMAEQSEKKSVRKACDQQINSFAYQLFKEFVKEKYGDEAYHEILDKVMNELQAYKISGLMRHEYTRARNKANITSINKL